MNDVLKLARLLHLVRQAQARYILTNLNLGRVLAGKPPPSLANWVPKMAEACKPLLLGAWQTGMLKTAARRMGGGEATSHPMVSDASGHSPSLLSLIDAAQDGGRSYRPGNEAIFGTAKGVMWDGGQGAGLVEYVVKAGRSPLVVSRLSTRGPGAFPGTGRPFLIRKALTNPRVLDALDEMVFAFCRETNETATRELDEALVDLRRVLRAGLRRGDVRLGHTDAESLLAGRIRRIFADPARAARIAATEYHRATMGGQQLAAKEAGARWKVWIAGARACKRCMELNGKRVKIDKPFWVDPGGGPYAVVYCPPLHPWCDCDFQGQYG